MAAKYHKKTMRQYWRVALTALMLVVIVVAVVLNWGQFAASITILRHVSAVTPLYSVTLFMVAVVLSATSYRLLALKPVKFRQLLLVEVAATGVNRVLPAGSGSMGLHGLFLLKNRHSAAQAATVVGANNTLGFMAHVAMLAVVGLWQPALFQGMHIAVSEEVVWGVIALGGLLGSLLLVRKVRRSVAQFLRGIGQSLRSYGSRKHRVLQSALVLMTATWLTVAIFVISAQAVGIHISLLQGFIVYSIGVLFGAAVPTPGGLGGMEAGLVAGLIARGSAAPEAIAATLLFRLVLYWFPLLIAAPAFFVVRARKLV